MSEFRLLQGLSDRQRRQLEALMRRRTVTPGDVVIREGDHGGELFLVESGWFDVLKGNLRIAEVGPGGDFGGLALAGDQRRSATVVARQPGTLLRLSVEDIGELSADDPNSSYAVIARNMLSAHGADLRRSSDDLVQSLREQLAEANKRLKMGSFLAVITIMMCGYGFFLRGSIDAISGVGDSTPITVGILGFYLLTIYVMMRRSGYPLALYGLTLHNWRAHLLESLAWTAVFLTVVTGAKWLAIQFVAAWAGEPLFAFTAIRNHSAGEGLGIAALYAVFAPSQEFIARGALQSLFQEFLAGRFVTTRAIVLSTLMFMATHLHLSTAFAMLTLIPSVFWGVLYARQRGLLGVSVSHVLIGLWIVFVLGIPGVDV